MYTKEIYEIDDIIELFKSKLDIDELKDRLIKNPLNGGKGSTKTGDKEERQYISQVPELNFVHANDIISNDPNVHLASYNQYEGDIIYCEDKEALTDMAALKEANTINFDIKISSRAPLVEENSPYPKWFVGCITKDSLKGFGAPNHFYLSFSKNCDTCVIGDSYLIKRDIQHSQLHYKYTKSNEAFITFNQMIEGVHWKYLYKR